MMEILYSVVFVAVFVITAVLFRFMMVDNTFVTNLISVLIGLLAAATWPISIPIIAATFLLQWVFSERR